jgi:hypothetical protein
MRRGAGSTLNVLFVVILILLNILALVLVGTVTAAGEMHLIEGGINLGLLLFSLVFLLQRLGELLGALHQFHLMRNWLSLLVKSLGWLMRKKSE